MSLTTDATDDVAVLRVEQLYPLPASELVQQLERYPNAREVVWVQEEPANMGAWQFMAVNLPPELPSGRSLSVVSRRARAIDANICVLGCGPRRCSSRV